MPRMVAFFYDKDAADTACDVLKKENIYVTMVDTRLGSYFELLWAGNSNGYRILVPDDTANRAQSILREHSSEIMNAGVENLPPFTLAEKLQNYLWLTILLLLIGMMIIGFFSSTH